MSSCERAKLLLALVTSVAPVPYRALVVLTRRPTRLLNLM